VTVEFLRRLRDVQRFATADELAAQLQRDREDALRALTELDGPVSL
jgi:FAD synthase